MSKVDEIAKRIQEMPIKDLIKMASDAIDSDMTESQLDFIFINLEISLQKQRLKKQLGIK